MSTSDNPEHWHFDKNPVTDFQGLLSGYDSSEFESPLRSTVPLLSLIRDGRPALQEIFMACNFPSGPSLHFEFTVDSPKGVGLPSHTDLMVRSGNSQLALEAKWTEPRYETVERWRRKPPDPVHSGEYPNPDNRGNRLKGWLELIQPHATRPLVQEEFSSIVYQMVHRAASACASTAHPQLAYMLFTPLPDGKNVKSEHYYRDLTQFHQLLGEPPGFPFHLIEMQISPTDAFRDIQHLPKGSSETASIVQSALRHGGLFEFIGFRLRTI